MYNMFFQNEDCLRKYFEVFILYPSTDAVVPLVVFFEDIEAIFEGIEGASLLVLEGIKAAIPLVLVKSLSIDFFNKDAVYSCWLCSNSSF